jgi:hypothetical protein
MQQPANNTTNRLRLKLLLDSNVVVAAEPYAGSMEANVELATALVRLAGEFGHILCVAPATRDDVLQNLDPERKKQRLAELMKFSQLAEVPLTAALVARAGYSEPGSNNHRDLRLLATIDAGAASYLVTEDQRLQRRARRAGLGDSVLSLGESVELLLGFTTPATPTPPRVERCPAYTLDPEQPIFTSLRQDYVGFDAWFDRVRRDSDNRTCFLIRDDQAYAALALLKDEVDSPYGIDGQVTKASTLKVEGSYGQMKYGELLLKSIFLDAHERGVRSLYVEVFRKHELLISMLTDFGFMITNHSTSRGELVMLKSLKPQPSASQELDDLDFHIRYGPPALRLTQRAFVVPILPTWHDQLFPERATYRADDQLPLFEIASNPITHPWGNALRKAYLCNSPSNQIGRGDVLLFYRSKDTQSVCAVGVVETTIRSSDAQEIAQFVGRRTVYTLDEISVMCRSVRRVLAIRFRQDRFVEPELPLVELQLAGIVRSWPQSITQVPKESMEWLRTALGV